MTDQLLSWRREFPIVDTCTYLVSHSLGAMPRRTSAYLAKFADEWGGRGVRGAHVADGIHLVAMAARDEPGLEGERAGGRLQEGANRVVGRGQELCVEAERLRDPRRRLAQGRTAAQELGPDEMKPEVAVAEAEPVLERVPALVGTAPAAGVVRAPRECVEDAVEVGRHSKPEHFDVVRHVAYDGNVAWLDYS